MREDSKMENKREKNESMPKVRRRRRVEVPKSIVSMVTKPLSKPNPFPPL